LNIGGINLQNLCRYS